MTQCEQIIEYIRRYGSITDVEAYADFGIRRLAARVSDLKDRGYNIKSVGESGKNRFGKKTHYTRYFLED